MLDLANTNKPREKTYSDSTLMNMRKADLVEYIRTLEHNYDVAVQFNAQQAKNCEALLMHAGMKDVITADAEGRLLVLDTQKEDTYPGLNRKERLRRENQNGKEIDV